VPVVLKVPEVTKVQLCFGVGAAVEIPYKIHKMLSRFGLKLFLSQLIIWDNKLGSSCSQC
jgi:hypothetical protein